LVVVVVGFRAQRLDVIRMLNLQPPSSAQGQGRWQWSAWAICEAWAEQMSFFTAKSGRPDVYRAATSILHHTGQQQCWHHRQKKKKKKS
jgi:hypothetical protein